MQDLYHQQYLGIDSQGRKQHLGFQPDNFQEAESLEQESGRVRRIVAERAKAAQ